MVALSIDRPVEKVKVTKTIATDALTPRGHVQTMIFLENSASIALFASPTDLRKIAQGILDGVDTLEQGEVDKHEPQPA